MAELLNKLLLENQSSLVFKLIAVAFASVCLSVGLFMLSKFSRTIVIDQTFNDFINSIFLNRYFYLMILIEGGALIAYIILLKMFPLQQIFILNLLFCTFFVSVLSNYFMKQHLSMWQWLGYLLGILAIILINNK